MYALCVSGAVNMQGFVWKSVFHALYIIQFVHSFTDENHIIHATNHRSAPCEICIVSVSFWFASSLLVSESVCVCEH